MAQQKDVFERFNEGNLDLATAFWLFGVVGLFILNFVGGFISAFLGNWVFIPVFLFSAGILIQLGSCAEKYIKDKEQKKISPVWGYLTYVYCGINALSLIFFAYEILTGKF